MFVIGIHGRAHSGKDSALHALMDRYGADSIEHISFARPLKDIVKLGYNLTEEQVTDPVLKEQPIYPGATVTVRQLLQQWGTDILRPVLGDNIFVNAAKGKAMASKKPLVVFTDVRFENEAIMIHSIGGIVIHVVRPDHEGTVHSSHASEQPLDSKYINVQIMNYSTLEDYKKQVVKVVELFRPKEDNNTESRE